MKNHSTLQYKIAILALLMVTVVSGCVLGNAKNKKSAYPNIEATDTQEQLTGKVNAAKAQSDIDKEKADAVAYQAAKAAQVIVDKYMMLGAAAIGLGCFALGLCLIIFTNSKLWGGGIVAGGIALFSLAKMVVAYQIYFGIGVIALAAVLAGYLIYKVRKEGISFNAVVETAKGIEVIKNKLSDADIKELKTVLLKTQGDATKELVKQIKPKL